MTPIINWHNLHPGPVAMGLVTAKCYLKPIPKFETLMGERLLFVHIPKNAGTSIANMFFGRGFMPGHYKWWFYRYYFGSHDYERMFKFAFSRSPFSRLASAYFYLRAGGNSARDLAFARENLFEGETFAGFVERLVRFRALREWLHFQPQHPFVFDRHDRLRVDHLARFENFSQEVETLEAKLGRAVQPLHEKKGAPKELRAFYESDRTRNLVASLYAKDFELLGYDTRL